MAATQDTDGDRLIARMSALRNASHHHVEELHHEANRLVDWREHVRAMPVIAVAVVALAGFALTVGWRKKAAPVTIERRESRPAPKRTLLRGTLSLAGSLAFPLIRQYAMRQLQEYLREPKHESTYVDDGVTIKVPRTTTR
jgi:hypothetical protein